MSRFGDMAGDLDTLYIQFDHQSVLLNKYVPSRTNDSFFFKSHYNNFEFLIVVLINMVIPKEKIAVRSCSWPDRAQTVPKLAAQRSPALTLEQLNT